ncbi:MGDG synthase family glycosyltransferase [Paenibacillus physcomitrellae]|nr:glycosyltransferase [Paenibacillus physcomitrellae]
MRQLRIMILTAGYGEGHNQVSRAVEQEFAARGIKDVFIVDLMKEAHPLLNSVSTKLYLKSSLTSQYGLDLYGWSYYWTRGTRPGSSLGKYFNSLGKRKLKALLSQVSPDIILNTFPFGAAAEAGNELDVPVCTVITDYTLHGRWTHPAMSRYYVATDELKYDMEKKAFASAQQILVTGIPVRRGFVLRNQGAGDDRGHYQQQEIPSGDRAHRNKLVMLSAGSFGVPQQLEEIVRRLLAAGNCRLAIVCGRNERLYARWSAMFGGNPKVEIFGFVPNIHEIMAQAACLVTKAGGVTLSEAIALRVPVFIYKPFSGQEKENAVYLAGKGAATIAESAPELSRQISRLLDNPAEEMGIRRRMSDLCKGVAAEKIVSDMLELLESRLRVTV